MSTSELVTEILCGSWNLRAGIFFFKKNIVAKLKMKTSSLKVICHLLLFLVNKTNCTKLPQDCQSQILLNQQTHSLSLSQFSYPMARD